MDFKSVDTGQYLPLTDSGLGELPAFRGYQVRLEDAGSGLQAVSDDQPVLYIEELKRSIDWLVKRLIKGEAWVSYHARKWYVHVVSAFPLARCYRVVTAWGP
jgi:hypothetical protein